MSFADKSVQMREIMREYGRVQAAFGDDTARFFMDVNLTMAQFRALATVRRWNRLTGRSLAAHLHITPGTLVPLVDRLEEQGYLRRVPDREDRRVTWLETTSKGNRFFHRMWLAGANKMLRAVSRLSDSDRATLHRLLQQIAAELEHEVYHPATGDEAAHRPTLPTLAVD
ncbi:MAG TPA: MarR family transcriptional regulator [Candidatus Dormibacteraeota bacterium]|nr:MarR family transcriptional regulator [Candidatus Dormibacteraeota bacterium]